MSIPIIHNNIRYIVTNDSKIFSLYPYVFIGYRFLGGKKYKLYKVHSYNVLYED